MADAGELFVKVRPNTAGFTSEASGPIASAGRDLSKVFLAAFAIGGIATTIRSVVEAATSHQAAFATLEQTVKRAGAENELYGLSLEKLLEKEARLKGFSDESLASSFVRLVSVTKDSSKAFKDLGLAEDLSRARHIDLATAALALAKAESGSATALQRYLGKLPAVTAAEDDLKRRHDETTAAGYKLTQQDKELYASALAAAKAADQQATATRDLAIVQERFGGVAATFADTASGQFQRLQQDFHQFEVAIGTPLLSGLAGAVEGVGTFFTHLTASGDAAKAAKGAAHELGTALHDVGAVAETIGPPLLVLAKGVDDVVSAVGAPTLLAAYATFKGLGLAIAGAGVAQEFYDRVLLANVGVTVEATAANAELAGSYTAVGLASALSAGERGIGAFAGGLGALAAGGGPLGLAVLGTAALAGGIVYLTTHEDTWAATNRRVAGSLRDLAAAEQQAGGAQGTLEIQAATNSLLEDRKKTIDALIAQGEKAQQKGTLSVLGSASKIDAADFGFSANLTARQVEKLGLTQKAATTSAQIFSAELGKQALALQTTNPTLAHQVELVGDLALKLGRIPTEKEISLIVKITTPQGTNPFDFITKLLDISAEGVAKDAKAGGVAHEKLVRAGNSAIAALRQGITGDQTALAQLKTDMADSITQGAEAVDQAVQQAKQNLNAIGQSLAQSIATFVDKPLNDAAQRLSDAQDRIAAVYDRKSAALNAKIAAVSAQQAQISALGNRQSLENIREQIRLPGGKALSKDPREALRELDALQAAATAKLGHADPALAAYILQYRSASLRVTADQLNLKKSALDAQHTAATTGIQLSTDALKLRQDAAAHQVQVAATGIANLTDELNKGLINPSEFEIQLNKILAKNHLTFIAAAKRDGIAFADTFNAQLTGLVAQEAALIGGPARTGTGLIPSIVRPIETLQQTQNQIAGIAKQQRKDQLDETKKQTALLKKIHADRAGVAFTSSLTKNPGGASTKQKDLVGASG